MASGPNVTANLYEAERLITKAAEADARLVVLPENFAIMGMQETDKVAVREPEGRGPIQAFLAEQARRHGVWLVGGTIPLEASVPGKVRAACLVYDSSGERVARYDKMHLFDVRITESAESYTESRTIEPGERLAVIETPFGRLGLAVCYDLRFPELFRGLFARGMEILALPAAFTAITGRAHWEVLVRARAIENFCYVVASAQGGYHF
ncbi:MAG: carbon-nitrogen hydrolase family protein, partial [Gammaproteobacteria bacterium]|nr:carbon-nitrogen hydrolase family protein [Gammaproteobacteria bacterium]